MKLLDATLRAAHRALVRAAHGFGPAPRVAQPFTAKLPSPDDGGPFIVVGDLQRTSPLELWRESNDAERAALVRAIAAARPSLLVIAGDLVFDGASALDWADFDVLTTPLREASVPVVAIAGNHEHWGGPGGAEHFFARFPALGGQRHYTLSHGALHLVFLDSNADAVPAVEWEQQVAWYEATLSALDGDPSVRAVVVILHHPPFTNSTVTGDELHVQRSFVPAFLRARKTVAMLSGHVHSYERFARAKKTFVVSGGGGGPRARLATGARRRHTDDLFAGPPLRHFHYLAFTLGDAGLHVEVMGLTKGSATLARMDGFCLPWPT